jgi:hypothetical protein
VGGGGAESYDSKKAWSYIIQSKRSGMSHFGMLRKKPQCYKERFATFCFRFRTINRGLHKKIRPNRVINEIIFEKLVNFNEIETGQTQNIDNAKKIAINEAI